MSDLLNMIEMDENAKRVFMAMSREDQLFAILGMLSYVRTKLVEIERAQIDTKTEFQRLKTDQVHFRQVRERRERQLQDAINKLIGRSDTQPVKMGGDDEENTTEKVAAEVAKIFASRFDFWIWFRDKILPTLLLTIILSLLYLAFQKP